MISLGGVTLPESLVWVDRHESHAVAQFARLTTEGNTVVFAGTLQSGFPVTLEARQNRGWLTLPQLQSVESMADQAGATFTLVFGSESFTVMFRHHEAPAVEFEPLVPRVSEGSSDADRYTGTIKLMIV